MKIPWVALQVGTSLVTMVRKIYLLPKTAVKVANWQLTDLKKIEKSIDDWLNYHTYNDTA